MYVGDVHGYGLAVVSCAPIVESSGSIRPYA